MVAQPLSTRPGLHKDVEIKYIPLMQENMTISVILEEAEWKAT
jgi:hypothetical protein